MDEDGARAVLQRFGPFADQFADGFGRRVQRAAASHDLTGLVNDSARKSMHAMHGRLSDAGTYQSLQHFMTDSPWPTAGMWARLRALIPERRGILAVDDTGFPTQGPHSVAVCGVLHAWSREATVSCSLAAIGRALAPRAWRYVSWGQGTKGPLAARFVARRVRLRHGRGERWVLFERSLANDARKYDVLNRDATASLKTLVRLARSRWPIEQQYQELTDELGLDHFEGRTHPGWAHHTVLTAVAFTFLQMERRRWPDDPRPTLPCVRAWMREIAAILYFVGNDPLFNLALSFRRNPPLRR